jgi:hypothetical protein
VPKRAFLTAKEVLELYSIEDFALKMSKIITQMKKEHADARLAARQENIIGSWLFPNDWANPFFDFAFICLRIGEVYLRAFQATTVLGTAILFNELTKFY